jgi:DNA-binding transcriptional regulator YhcF (GntR family)
MRFWFVHSSDVSLQQQIVTQVSLGILSGELAAGERLPSIRELARRFHIHPNTISAGYRQLEREHWVTMRKGSGVYVRESQAHQQSNPTQAIDTLIEHLLRIAQTSGITAEELNRRFQAITTAQPAQRFLLIEPEPELQQIVLAELKPHLHLSIETSVSPENISDLSRTVVLVLPSKAEAVRAALPPSTPIHILAIRSIPASLAPWLPAPSDTLIAVASHWPRFLTLAHTMLVAAGFHSDAILIRNASEPNWQHGLTETAAVVCDTHTATLLPSAAKPIPFSLLAPETVQALARQRP